MRAWGNDTGGQLGVRPLYAATPKPIPGLHSVLQITSGRLHSLVRRSDNSVWGWGAGALGDGTAESRSRPSPSLLAGAALVSAGGHQSFAIKTDGSLWAFGHNNLGQLGDGTTIDRYIAVAVLGMAAVRGVATGFSHTIAVKQDGTVWSWGANFNGELGTGFGAGRLVPAQVAGLTGVTAVAAPVTGAHSVALKSDGTVWTWGRNDYGQLGDGTHNGRLSAAPVPGISSVAKVAAGESHMLAVTSDGSVWGGEATPMGK